jgi:flagellar protein FliS
MNHREAADAYRRAAIEHAPPIKLVRMLYAGALRFLEQAMAEDPRDPRSLFIDRVDRVDRIVSELRLALVASPSPEVFEQLEQLEQLYVFAETRLAEAAAQRSHNPRPAVKNVLETLGDAWNRVDLSEISAA